MKTMYKLITLCIFQLSLLTVLHGQPSPSVLEPTSSEQYCPPLWQDHIFGDCMGRNNSFIAFDYDSDGVDELIVNAHANGNPTSSGFWYILEYNTTTSQYEQAYVSRIYEDWILKLAVSDQDASPRLGVAFEDVLHIYDLSTQSLIREIEYGNPDWNFTNTDLHFRDINADGIQDILINGRSWFQIIDGQSYESITQLEGDFWRFAIGNVDDDTDLEIVSTSGIVYNLSSEAEMVEEYSFVISAGVAREIVLEDVDGDGRQEGIVAYSSQGVEVFDLETGNSIMEIPLFAGTNNMILKDIEGDSLKEMIVTSATSGIMLFDLATGDLLRSLWTDEIGIPSIAIADFDDDGIDEVVYSSPCASSNDDHLYVIAIDESGREFRSTFIEGEFFGVEVEDLDQDGNKELITLSNRVNWGGGILSIYDAKTKELKHRTEESDFPETIVDAKFIEIMDYGHDGDLDIVISGRVNLDGKIWVVDGTTYELEFDYLFPSEVESIDAIQKITSANGNDDLIMTAGKKLFQISGMNLDILWQEEIPQFISDDHQLLIYDLDADGMDDIIVTEDIIQVFDLNGQFKYSSGHEYYTVSQPILWGMENEPLLAAGTRDGKIHLLDENLNIIRQYDLGFIDVTNIVGADVDEDGSNEIIFGTEDYIGFLKSDGRLLQNPIGKEIGWFDGFKYVDYDDDGIKSLILGSLTNVMEIDLTCIQCLLSQNDVLSTNASCGSFNGSIEVVDVSKYLQMTMEGEEFNGMADSLEEGTYDIVLEEFDGCTHSYSVEIINEELNALILPKEVSCPDGADGKLLIYVETGKPDYTFTLTENMGLDTSFLSSDTIFLDSIINLSAGIYDFDIVDGNGCTEFFSFEIEERELPSFSITQQSDDVSTEEPDGSIEINGPEYTVLWEDGSTESERDSLFNGMYSITLTDMAGCVLDTTVILTPVNSVGESEQPTLTLQPNPAKEFVYLHGINEPLDEVLILTMEGQIIKNVLLESSEENQVKLDISHLSSGIYIVYIRQSESRHYLKLIKQ